MKTILTFLIITLFCSLPLVAQETKDVCDCPPPTQDDINELCAKIFKNGNCIK